MSFLIMLVLGTTHSHHLKLVKMFYLLIQKPHSQDLLNIECSQLKHILDGNLKLSSTLHWLRFGEEVGLN